MTGSMAAGGARLEGHSAGHSTAFVGGGFVAPSRRAVHCALISEMRSSLRDQASAWIWERELARGRLASSLIAATAGGVVLSVPALSLCWHHASCAVFCGYTAACASLQVNPKGNSSPAPLVAQQSYFRSLLSSSSPAAGVRGLSGVD